MTPDNQRSLGFVWYAGLTVAAGCAALTAHGLFTVAVAAGVPWGLAWMYPLVTDGLALVGYLATAKLRSRTGCNYAWAVVVVCAGLSGLAQAVHLAGGVPGHVPPGLRFGTGGWPAVAFAVTFHLLFLIHRATFGSPIVRKAKRKTSPAVPVPTRVTTGASPVVDRPTPATKHATRHAGRRRSPWTERAEAGMRIPPTGEAIHTAEETAGGPRIGIRLIEQLCEVSNDRARQLRQSADDHAAALTEERAVLMAQAVPITRANGSPNDA